MTVCSLTFYSYIWFYMSSLSQTISTIDQFAQSISHDFLVCFHRVSAHLETCSGPWELFNFGEVRHDRAVHTSFIHQNLNSKLKWWFVLFLNYFLPFFLSRSVDCPSMSALGSSLLFFSTPARFFCFFWSVRGTDNVSLLGLFQKVPKLKGTHSLCLVTRDQ